MYINNLKLINFRNFEKLNIELSKGINIFTGDNAQGKTNILESIYYCSLGKSHRTTRDRELIKWDAQDAYVNIYVCKERIDKNIEIKIFNDGKKGININSIRMSKLSDLLGVFNVVMFSPEDLKIVKESPSFRRKFLDIELCKLNKQYYYNLSQYSKVLNERNLLFKKFKENIKNMVDIYDEQLAAYGGKIIQERVRYIKRLNEKGNIIHKNITLNNENIQFKYVSPIKNIDNSACELRDLLKNNLERDIYKGTTEYGPHRDDFSIKINDIDTRNYGSQGQQRTSVLTLKFASLEIIKDFIGEYPVLLLDDVMSELDLSRQKYILNSINKYQTIITCTGVESINNILQGDVKVFKVKSGNVFNNIKK